MPTSQRMAGAFIVTLAKIAFGRDGKRQRIFQTQQS